jgi:hypothetical protein
MRASNICAADKDRATTVAAPATQQAAQTINVATQAGTKAATAADHATGTPAQAAVPHATLAQAAAVALQGGPDAVQKYMAGAGYPRSGNWCGEFAASVVSSQGLKPPANPEVASNWRNWGTVDNQPKEGDVAVRRGVPTGQTGSHVTFVGHVNADGTFTGIGGNQGGTKQYRADEFEFRRPPEAGSPEGEQGVPHPGGQPPGTAPSTAPKPVTRESVLPKESLLRGFGRALLVGAYGPAGATVYEQVQQARMGVMQSNYDLQERENMINYQNNSAQQNGKILADLAHAPGSAPSPAGAAAGVSGRALPETEAPPQGAAPGANGAAGPQHAAAQAATGNAPIIPTSSAGSAPQPVSAGHPSTP